MNLRPVHFLPLTTLLLLGSPDLHVASTQPAYTLRIESLSPSPIDVGVRTLNTHAARNRLSLRDTILVPPARLSVPDTVDRVHVVVSGFALVRVTLSNSEVPTDSLVSVGRDITLSRKTDGRFERIWTAQELVP
jgi:hypothetical protein